RVQEGYTEGASPLCGSARREDGAQHEGRGGDGGRRRDNHRAAPAVIGRWKGFLAVTDTDPVRMQKIRECCATIDHHLATIREIKAILRASRKTSRGPTTTHPPRL